MDSDDQRRDFSRVAIALGSDPDLALARAMQLQRERPDLGPADAYLLVLGELSEGRL